MSLRHANSNKTKHVFLLEDTDGQLLGGQRGEHEQPFSRERCPRQRMLGPAPGETPSQPPRSTAHNWAHSKGHSRNHTTEGTPWTPLGDCSLHQFPGYNSYAPREIERGSAVAWPTHVLPAGRPLKQHDKLTSTQPQPARIIGTGKTHTHTYTVANGCW